MLWGKPRIANIHMSDQSPPPAIALTIAGSDPSAGAGLQADLKTFAAHGVYGLSAVTCTTAQVPGRVSSVSPVSPEHLHEQISILLANYRVAAIKTGMLFSIPLMEAVKRALDEPKTTAPLVVDPVMIATSGDPLLEKDAIRFYREVLIPRASLFTPNLDEAGVLLDGTPITEDNFEAAGAELHSRYGAPVLLKGGHLQGETAIDLLVDGKGAQSFAAPFVKGVSTHGTGCTYSAAIAAGLANSLDLRASVAAAKRYITAAIASSHRWPSGMEALDHFPRCDDPQA